MNIKSKITGGITIAAMMAGVLASSAGATGGSGIGGNGAFSRNFMWSFDFMQTMLNQRNTTTAHTIITTHSTSGHNDASFNTSGNSGGSSMQSNGGSSSNVGVVIGAGDNMLTIAGCGCADNGGMTSIIGNGAFSHNTALDTSINKFKLEQANTVLANTRIDSTSNSGGNTASFNTGSNVTQTSGNTTSNVGVSVTGGDNNATVSDNCGCASNSSGSVIAGNGAFSDNMIVSTNTHTTDISQTSNTTADTTVHSTANSGGNKANFNTGGTVNQTSGSASSNVGVVVTGGNNTLHN